MVNAQAELLMKPAVQALTTGADLPQSWLGADLPVESDPSPPFTLCNLLHLPRSEFWIHPIHHCTAILGFPLCSKPPLLDCCLMIFSGLDYISNGDCQLASSMNWESGSEPAEAFEHCSYGRWSTNHDYSWMFRILLESFWVYVTSPNSRNTKNNKVHNGILFYLFGSV